MPEGYASALAKHLSEVCSLRVKEAVSGDRLSPGMVLVAPGQQHMGVAVKDGAYFARVGVVAGVSLQRSIDVLFQSCATSAPKNTVGVILTGAGSDGAAGLRKMRDAGGRTIAQDEATSAVFEMPRHAIQQGAAEFVLPLQGMAREVLKLSCAA